MSRNRVLHSWIRPVITIITAAVFFTVIILGLWVEKVTFDRALDVLSGIFGWTVGYFFAKREGEKDGNPSA